MPICASSIATSSAGAISSGRGLPAATSTAAGPTVNQALPGVSSSRAAGVSPRMTSGARAITIATITATGTSQPGSRNRVGTSASWTGDVQAFGRSIRAAWLSASIATLTANRRRSTSWLSGSSTYSAAIAANSPAAITISARTSARGMRDAAGGSVSRGVAVRVKSGMESPRACAPSTVRSACRLTAFRLGMVLQSSIRSRGADQSVVRGSGAQSSGRPSCVSEAMTNVELARACASRRGRGRKPCCCERAAGHAVASFSFALARLRRARQRISPSRRP